MGTEISDGAGLMGRLAAKTGAPCLKAQGYLRCRQW